MSDVRSQVDEGGELYGDDVSRAYRLAAREEPSPRLDDAIHAAAVRAAGSRRRAFPRNPLRRWSVPIAVAATIVVGVSVAFLAADRPDSPLLPATEVPLGQLGESKQSAAVPDAPALRQSTSAGDSAREAPQQQGPSATKGQAPVTAAAREARPSRERTTRDQLVPRRDEAPNPTAAPADASADVARAAPAGVPRAAQPPTPPDAARGTRKTAPAAEAQADQEAELLSPEPWLQRIRELRNKGELAQADESLRAFRRRYPDYPLPADIPAPAQAGK